MSAVRSLEIPLGRPPSPLWQRSLGTLAGMALGAVLLVAAYAKLLDPLAFVEQIRAEKLDFLLSAKAVAYLALALEVGLGTALLLGLRRRWVLLAATALVLFFLFLTGRSWYLDAHGLLPADASCGCFGNLMERTPREAFWQDALLMVPALALAFVGRRGPRRVNGAWRAALAACAALGAVGFATQAPKLALDDLATRLHAGARTAEICSGRDTERICLGLGVVPELATGEHVVALVALDDPALAAAVPGFNQYALSGGKPSLWVLTAASPEAKRKFDWENAPAFALREAPPSLLRPLYRTLPRSFVVKDGVVIKTLSGLPTRAELGG